MNPYLKALKDQVKAHPRSFIANNATVLGQVRLAEDVSIWYGAVLRADHDSIDIGDGSNIQDNAVCHVDPGFPIVVGKRNVIGHSAILHGCTIGNDNLIGMRATLMNGVKIGNGCIIGAHALLTEGMEVPDFSLVLGSPGKIVRRLEPEIVKKINRGTEAYIKEAQKYLQAIPES